MLFGFRSFRMTLVVCGFLTFGTQGHLPFHAGTCLHRYMGIFPLSLGLCTWVGMANTQPEGGFINNDITMIVVPVGIGILGSILYAFFWNLTMYLVGGLGGLALGLFILCWREDLVITQVCFFLHLRLVGGHLFLCITSRAGRELARMPVLTTSTCESCRMSHGPATWWPSRSLWRVLRSFWNVT